MNETKIEWADRTWNPVTGCEHGCKYCYARGICKRFNGGGLDKYGNILPGAFECEEKGLHVLDEPQYRKTKSGKIVKASFPFGFEPTYHRYRLDQLQHVKEPQAIFVVDMGDLFGEWVPDSWINEVFKACEAAPQHTYLFLTKNPVRFITAIRRPKENMWFGTTICTRIDMDTRGSDLFVHPWEINTFLSIEPILEDINDMRVQYFKQVIIGAETGNRKDKIIPKPEWVKTIVDQCRAAKVPVFLKDNIRAIYEPVYGPAPRELAWEVRK